jgi:hypothetical protein
VLWKLWDILTGYLKDSPWGRAPSLFSSCSSAASSPRCSHTSSSGPSGFSPDLRIFLASYMSVRIALVTGALLALMVLLRLEPQKDAEEGGTAAGVLPAQSPLDLLSHRRHAADRGVHGDRLPGALAIACQPHHRPVHGAARRRPERGARLRHLRVNRPQRQWHFDVDFAPFNELALTSRERERCQADSQPLLCHAEQMAGDRSPVIAITDRPLNGTYFAAHRGLHRSSRPPTPRATRH